MIIRFFSSYTGSVGFSLVIEASVLFFSVFIVGYVLVKHADRTKKNFPDFLIWFGVGILACCLIGMCIGLVLLLFGSFRFEYLK